MFLKVIFEDYDDPFDRGDSTNLFQQKDQAFSDMPELQDASDKSDVPEDVTRRYNFVLGPLNVKKFERFRSYVYQIELFLY